MLTGMASIPGLTQRMICGLLASITPLFGCGDDETGDEVAETSSESSSESTSEDSSTDGSTDSTGSEASTETDSTETTESETTESDSTESETTESETTESDSTETGDPSCEDDSYIGVALAEDGWGIGDLCDQIWVCADEDQVPLIMAAVPDAMCFPEGDCPDTTCTISFQTIVDEAVFADVCDALMVPGIDEAYCIILGP
jgi:hypothetical protein